MTLRLLIADDSATIQKVIRLAFQGTDTVIESVSDGGEVRQALHAFRPNIVLADISMPGLSGYQICSLVKGSPDFSRTPVVLLVGTYEKFDESEAARVQYDARLTKPFDPSELVNVVHTLAERKAIREEPLSGSAPHSAADKAPSRNPVQSPLAARRRMGISRRCLESFAGECAVLELFEHQSPREALRAPEPADFSSLYETEAKGLGPEAIQITAEMMTEDALEAIVKRVMQKMSTDVVSEIAWEIVPELSEIIIRRTLEEKSAE